MLTMLCKYHANMLEKLVILYKIQLPYIFGYNYGYTEITICKETAIKALINDFLSLSKSFIY